MSNRNIGPIAGAIILVVAAIGLALWGISTRARALTVVTEETHELAVPTVAVTKPTRGEAAQEIVLPGSIQAFADAPIYARTNGYLRKWYVDIGTRVKAGQLLADIDTPELDSQLDQARADLATTDANAKLALTTAERYRDLIKTDSVSKQDLDNANGGLEARQTAVTSARANVSRLEQLHAFGKIEAAVVRPVPMRNRGAAALSFKIPSSFSATLASARVARARSARTFPASVGSIPQVCRSSSRTPCVCSSSRTMRDTADCATFLIRAAPLMLPCSTTSRKSATWLWFMTPEN